MTADHAVPEDIRSLMETFSDRIGGPLTIVTAELARILERATNVREVSPTRWSGDTLALTAGETQHLMGLQQDRARLVLVKLAGASPIYIAPTQQLAQAAGTGSMQLPTNVAIELRTTGDVWAYTTAADAELTWYREEYDT